MNDGTKYLFVDIGGVLLTDGWGNVSRKMAAKEFGLDLKILEERHEQAFSTFELGKLTIEEYLKSIVFYQKQPFTPAKFQNFMFSQSRPYPQMIELIGRLKKRYGLTVIAVSNEARELNAYRIKKFKIEKIVDFFVSSCYVQLRKPDEEIFRVALDIAQSPAAKVVYIDNIQMFVEVAEGMGIRSIHHTDYKSTCTALARFGLEAEE